MNIKCLYEFNSFSEFSKFTEFTAELDWKIEKQLLKNRVLRYRNLEQFNVFKDTFKKKKLSIFTLKEEEIITWFDTSVLMRKIFFDLYKKGLNTEGISIFMEYPIVFGNHMRSDYLLVFDRLIIVLEFGMFNQDERRSEERYSKKLQESIGYRQIIANMMPEEIKVINYVMIYKPEYNDDYNANMNENIKYNNGEINKLVQFLYHHITQENMYKARNQLELISKFN